MNWTKWSSIAEILSSVAILVTLVFLTAQMRQNTVAVQASSLDGSLSGDLQLLENLIRDPALWFLQYKEELTEDESVQLYHYLAALVRIQERNWLLRRSGALDEAEYVSYQSGFLGTILAPNARQWWENTQSAFNAEFASDVNVLIDGLPTATAGTLRNAFN